MSYNGVVKTETFRKRLLGWYRENRRALPWRETRDPYRIWVSEAMLQQTQVATVIPYYQRFLQRFPTVNALARAPVTDVLDQWSGLGYYSRAKNLHAGAREVVRRYGGKLPDQAETLQELPGIGRYTAGAIASIAFDRPAPLVDGNVIRVLSRCFGIREDPRAGAVQKKLWKIAGALVPEKNPGDFNQALMELGATVCLPRQPACGSCPLTGGCVARQKGWQERIPPPRPEVPKKKLLYLGALLEKEGALLLGRRPITGLLPGLWELPGGEVPAGAPEPEELARLVRERTGLRVIPSAAGKTAVQILSHRRIELRSFPCRWSGRLRAPRWYTDLRWFPPPALAAAALTAGIRKLLHE